MKTRINKNDLLNGATYVYRNGCDISTSKSTKIVKFYFIENMFIITWKDRNASTIGEKMRVFDSYNAARKHLSNVIANF
jgi:hypothetical protein